MRAGPGPARIPVRRDAALKIDLHLHTRASYDCRTPFDEVVLRCRQRGIHVQAVTDHDQIWGAREVAARAGDDLTVIVGEEISTPEGEIIGLFLQERVPPRLTPEDTVAAIREQGGLVLLPHGFDPYKAHRLRPAARERIADEIDVVEVFNARVSHPRRNREARDWAVEQDVPASAGTDAHIPSAIGEAWVQAPDGDASTPEGLLRALRFGVPDGTWVHPIPAYGYKLWDSARRVTRRALRRAGGRSA